MDLLEGLFVFCFVFGLATSAISFAVGSLGGDAGHDAGGHVNGHDLGGHDPSAAHAGSGADAPHGDGGHAPDAPHGVSPLNFQTATAFLTCFGGVGYVLTATAGVGPALALLGATLGGLAGGAVIFLFLARVLVAGQRFVSPEGSRLDGTVATVSLAIRPGGTGEIIFSRDGARRSEGARSATGAAIPAGTEVVVVRYEGGVAFVEPWASYAGEA